MVGSASKLSTWMTLCESGSVAISRISAETETRARSTSGLGGTEESWSSTVFHNKILTRIPVLHNYFSMRLRSAILTHHIDLAPTHLSS